MRVPLILWLSLLAAFTAPASASSVRKADLADFFAKLDAGRPVTVVAIGGSITMENGGWVSRFAKILRENYPDIPINFVNAGVSGTGSNLGVFRLGRDVEAHRPDLVILEFVVNDSGRPDETCLRNLESIVVRLSRMTSPPALVFLESASESGSRVWRHRQVATKYDILEVDTQPVIDALMARNGKKWTDLFKDEVHPNMEGHQIYAELLWKSLRENLARPSANKTAVRRTDASDDLILDGALVVPNFLTQNWIFREEPDVGWWSRFFEGASLQSLDGGAPLHMPFHGRAVGVWLRIYKGKGKLAVAVDGKILHEMTVESPKWRYSAYVYPELLEPGWHVLTLIPIAAEDRPASVRIGYLLLQDQRTASPPSEDFWTKVWPKRLDVKREPPE